MINLNNLLLFLFDMKNINKWEIRIYPIRKEEFGSKYGKRVTYTSEFDLRGLYKGLWEDYISNITDEKGMEEWIEAKRNYQKYIFDKIENSIKGLLSLVKDPTLVEVSVIPFLGMPETSFGMGQIYITLMGESIEEEHIKDSILYSLSTASRELFKEVENRFKLPRRTERLVTIKF